MDVILARLSRLEASNDRLLSENEAQRAALADLSTENTRLSSEVRELRSVVTDQGRTIEEISKAALPGGHWVWQSCPDGVEETAEAKRGGRWVWSLVRPSFAPPLDCIRRLTKSAPLSSAGALSSPRCDDRIIG